MTMTVTFWLLVQALKVYLFLSDTTMSYYSYYYYCRKEGLMRQLKRNIK